jgi:hypothetical protein
VVTNLPVSRAGAQQLYEKLYCVQGEMDNRIKEQKLGLFADRTSTQVMQANQLRVTARKVWLSFSEAHPYANDFARILANLHRYPAWAPPG